MVQSDALSRRPDLCPEEDNDNEDVVMLPKNVFIDLIDEGLQRRIAKVNDLDKDAMDALQLLLMDPPIPKMKELENWTLTYRTVIGFYSTKAKVTFQKILIFDETL